MMKKTGYVLATILMLVLAAFLLYEGWPVLLRFFDLIGRYMWVGIGIAVFFVLRYFAKKNRDWLETLSHELTHAVIAILFLREITSFQANKKNGVVWSRGARWSEPFVALAPYCLPLFTYIMLIIWSLVASRQLVGSHNHLWGIDLLVGITLGFHFVCFKAQTGNHETDITKFPTFFSYTYIWFFRLVNLLVILLCYMPAHKTGEPLKVWGAFWYLIEHFWKILF